jgi:hypothetical protein
LIEAAPHRRVDGQGRAAAVIGGWCTVLVHGGAICTVLVHGGAICTVLVHGGAICTVRMRGVDE